MISFEQAKNLFLSCLYCDLNTFVNEVYSVLKRLSISLYSISNISDSNCSNNSFFRLVIISVCFFASSKIVFDSANNASVVHNEYGVVVISNSSTF